MYKIPDDLELDKLKDEIIFQICFGLNYIILAFSKGTIQISGPFTLQIKNKMFSYNEIYPVNNDFGLICLLEKKILKSCICDERTTLRIVFEEEIELTLKSSDLYESFEILLEGRRVII